jgi:hypothetical protein
MIQQHLFQYLSVTLTHCLPHGYYVSWVGFLYPNNGIIDFSKSILNSHDESNWTILTE